MSEYLGKYGAYDVQRKKNACLHMRTTKARISLCIRASRSNTSLLAFRIIGYFRIYPRTEKSQIRLRRSEFSLFAYAVVLFSYSAGHTTHEILLQRLECANKKEIFHDSENTWNTINKFKERSAIVCLIW